jgi:hypothetical protein
VTAPSMISFLVIAAVSMACTLSVIAHIYHTSSFEDLRIVLIFLLHISVFIEDLSTLPYAYSWNDDFCSAMGWVHFYSGFCNINVVTLMGFHYLGSITSETRAHRINKWISYYGHYFIFGLPVITVFPFITDSYGVSNNNWCTLPSKSRRSNDWAVGIFYGWIWILLLVNILQLTYSLYRSLKYDREVCRRLVLSIGLYILLTILCWLPRTVPRFVHLFVSYDSSDELYLWTTLPLYLSGLGYAACYLLDVRMHPRQRRTSSIDSSQLSGLHIENVEQLFRDSADNPLVSSSSTSTHHVSAATVQLSASGSAVVDRSPA